MASNIKPIQRKTFLQNVNHPNSLKALEKKASGLSASALKANQPQEIKTTQSSEKFESGKSATDKNSSQNHLKQFSTYNRQAKISNKEIDEDDEDYENDEPISESDQIIEDEILNPEKEVQSVSMKRKSSAQDESDDEYDEEDQILTSSDGTQKGKTAIVSSKDNDTFYDVIDRQNTISEDQSGYTIEAFSPLGEKDNIRVSINNNKATISGSRKSTNKAEMDNRTIATHNYQTFQEEFNLESPLSAQGLQKERFGDYVRIFIPKLEQK